MIDKCLYNIEYIIPILINLLESYSSLNKIPNKIIRKIDTNPKLSRINSFIMIN